MWEFHARRKALATVGLLDETRSTRHGRVQLSDRGEISALDHEERKSGDGKFLANVGAYLFSRQFVDLVPDASAVSIEKEMLPPLIGCGLYGFRTEGLYLDIGDVQDLARAEYELPTFCMRRPHLRELPDGI
jgi:mannose-1-phosphate guanylyltransferase